MKCCVQKKTPQEESRKMRRNRGVKPSGKRRRYSKIFKKKAVEPATRGNYTAAGTGRNFGIGRNMPDRWRQEYRE
jgi:transposase-like protein